MINQDRVTKGRVPGRSRIGWSALLTLFLAACAAQVQLPTEPVPPAPVTRVWPAPPARPRITLIREIQLPRDIRQERSAWKRIVEFLAGREPQPTLVRPYGLTVDRSERLLVADTGAQRVHILDLNSGVYKHLPHPKDDLRLFSPIDVQVDRAGRIYVSDSEARRVHIFSAEGRLEKSLTGFERPTGLALNTSLGQLLVVDTKGQQIHVFNTTGDRLFAFGRRGGGNGEFNFPTNICLDLRGNIYVTDSMNFRIQVFNPQGTFLTHFGKAGDGPGRFSKPRGIAVDSDGHVYVSDASFDNVQIFNAKGQILLYFGAPGIAPGEFYLPAGITIDATDRIFVADSYNHRIQVFQYLKPDLESEKISPGSSRSSRNQTGSSQSSEPRLDVSALSDTIGR